MQVPIPFLPQLADQADMLRAYASPLEKEVLMACQAALGQEVLHQVPVEDFIVQFMIPALGVAFDLLEEGHEHPDGYLGLYRRKERLAYWQYRYVALEGVEWAESKEKTLQKLLKA